jgi:hypothetical protein
MSLTIFDRPAPITLRGLQIQAEGIVAALDTVAGDPTDLLYTVTALERQLNERLSQLLDKIAEITALHGYAA